MHLEKSNSGPVQSGSGSSRARWCGPAARAESKLALGEVHLGPGPARARYSQGSVRARPGGAGRLRGPIQNLHLEKSISGCMAMNCFSLSLFRCSSDVGSPCLDRRRLSMYVLVAEDAGDFQEVGGRQGAKRPTPTQSTCLYYDHDNEASKCVWSPGRARRYIYIYYPNRGCRRRRSSGTRTS